MEDAIYVAVNQDVRESKKTLLWALKNLQVKKIFLLHVHLPFSLTTSCKSFSFVGTFSTLTFANFVLLGLPEIL